MPSLLFPVSFSAKVSAAAGLGLPFFPPPFAAVEAMVAINQQSMQQKIMGSESNPKWQRQPKTAFAKTS
jgi:hypothetical protein